MFFMLRNECAQDLRSFHSEALCRTPDLHPGDDETYPRKLHDGLSDRAGDRAPQRPETGLVEAGPGPQEGRFRRLRVADDVEMVAEHEARGLPVEGLRPRRHDAVVRGR